MLFVGSEIERTGFLDVGEGDISCGGLEKEMELVVWELW